MKKQRDDDKVTTNSKRRLSRIAGVEGGKRVPLARYYQAPTDHALPERTMPNESSSQRFMISLMHLIPLVLMTGLLFGALLLNGVRIERVSNPAMRSVKDYQQLLQAGIKSPPGHLKPLFNTSDVNESLLRQWPEIEKIEWQVPLFGTTAKANVTIPATAFVLVGGEGEYIVNRQGRVIGELASLQGVEPPPIRVVDQTGFDVKVGRYVLGANETGYILTVAEQFAKKGITLQEFVLPPLAQELHVRADKPYVIKFHFAGDPLQQTGAYFAARQRLQSEPHQPTTYVDVRVGDRVFTR